MEQQRLVGAATAEQRRQNFEAGEKRYEDRRDAVTAFDEAVRNERDSIAKFEAEHEGVLSPGDIFQSEVDYKFEGINAALAQVSMRATPAVINAANTLRATLIDRFDGTKESEQRLLAALVGYQAAARDMLGNG